MAKWKQIRGYEGRYEVSDGGKVRNVKSGKTLAFQPTKKGYRRVGLWKNNRRQLRRVHRLVAEAHIGRQPRTKPLVNHKNLIKTDNRKSNLEYMDASENTLHAYANGAIRRRNGMPLTEFMADEISYLYYRRRAPVAHIMDLYDLDSADVYMILENQANNA